MKTLLLAAALVFAPISTARAQYLIDGTTPGATTTLEYSGEVSYLMRQSLVASGSDLARISFWFYGGTRTADSGTSRIWSMFRLVDADENVLHDQLLDHRTQGRVDITFGSPIHLVIGQPYMFWIYTNNCSIVDPPCGIGDAYAPVGDQQRSPALELTTSDAYAYGQFSSSDNYSPAPTRDIRFEAAYLVPEPSTYALMFAGLAALGLAARRRRVN